MFRHFDRWTERASSSSQRHGPPRSPPAVMGYRNVGYSIWNALLNWRREEPRPPSPRSNAGLGFVKAKVVHNRTRKIRAAERKHFVEHDWCIVESHSAANCESTQVQSRTFGNIVSSRLSGQSFTVEKKTESKYFLTFGCKNTTVSSSCLINSKQQK